MALSISVDQAIDKFFAHLKGTSGYLPVKAPGNRYELFIYSLVHNALSKYHTLKPEGLSATGQFRFKASPTFINNSFSYFSFNGMSRTNYELRNGIEVKGHALEHEIDVCIFNKVHPHGEYPLYSTLIFGLECKFYKDASSLKGEARKFLGAMSDLSADSDLIKGPQPAGCAHFGFSFFRAFVTNVSSTRRTRLQDFLSSYHLYPKFGIEPGTGHTHSFSAAIENFASSL
jgi:hypothetical protein